MLVRVDISNAIKQLTEELNNVCYCRFQDYKKDLEKLKEVLDKRWDEPIDTSCIE